LAAVQEAFDLSRYVASLSDTPQTTAHARASRLKTPPPSFTINDIVACDGDDTNNSLASPALRAAAQPTLSTESSVSGASTPLRDNVLEPFDGDESLMVLPPRSASGSHLMHQPRTGTLSIALMNQHPPPELSEPLWRHIFRCARNSLSLSLSLSLIESLACY
jgi:hypothetical protein